MKHLARNKRSIYLCKQAIKNDRIVFLEPVEYKLNFQPLSTDGEIIAAGSEYINRLVVYTNPQIAQSFHNGDRCYVFKNIPLEYKRTCDDADFFVDGEPMTFLNESRFYLQRMTGDDNLITEEDNGDDNSVIQSR